jgi:3'(2'), 5'-bisphosphate nucleotidase
VLTTTALRHTSKNEAAISAIKPTEVIRVGGAGYKASLVMENKADVYLYHFHIFAAWNSMTQNIYHAGGCKLWDTCAPHAIIKALGGN